MTLNKYPEKVIACQIEFLLPSGWVGSVPELS